MTDCLIAHAFLIQQKQAPQSKPKIASVVDDFCELKLVEIYSRLEY